MLLTTTAAAASLATVSLGTQMAGTVISKLASAVKSGSDITSLTDLSKPSRVEPIVLVDKALGDQPFMSDIMRMVLTIFTGYYVQGIASIMPVGSVDTMRLLDSVNPNRTQGRNLTGLWDAVAPKRDNVFSKEAYADGLPSLESFDEPAEKGLIVSSEAVGASIDDESAKKFYEVENLAVGKMVQVKITDGRNEAKMPIMVRLIPTVVPPQILTHIFTATAVDNSWKERYHKWRGGQISLIRDLIFQVDMIDAHRKALVNDTTNVYMSINDRKRNNALSSSLTNTPTMADASNIAVISKDTAKQLGRVMHGKLESVRVRKQIFDASYLMLLVVVDEQWERVVVYHRGLDQPTEASFRDIKSAEKGKGPDITEILKAYTLGASPSYS